MTDVRYSPAQAHHRPLWIGLLLACWLALPAYGQSLDLPEYPIAYSALDDAFPRASVIVVGGHQCHLIAALLADTPARRSRGLMFVKDMPARTGMVFTNPRSRALSMWMKNTLIPLDMIFIGADQRVLNIAANTTPLSLESQRSDGPARFVLELNGGESAELGLTAGRQVFIHAATPR